MIFRLLSGPAFLSPDMSWEIKGDDRPQRRARSFWERFLRDSYLKKSFPRSLK